MSYNSYLLTTNCGLLSNVPDGVTTDTMPVVAPFGTVALIYVSDSTVNAASTPLNVTLLDPVPPGSIPICAVENAKLGQGLRLGAYREIEGEGRERKAKYELNFGSLHRNPPWTVLKKQLQSRT